MTFNLAFFDSGLSWTARGAHVVLWPSWVEPSWDGLDLKYTAVLTLYIRMDTHTLLTAILLLTLSLFL